MNKWQATLFARPHDNFTKVMDKNVEVTYWRRGRWMMMNRWYNSAQGCQPIEYYYYKYFDEFVGGDIPDKVREYESEQRDEYIEYMYETYGYEAKSMIFEADMERIHKKIHSVGIKDQEKYYMGEKGAYIRETYGYNDLSMEELMKYIETEDA